MKPSPPPQDDWLPEWARLYAQLEPGERRAMLSRLRARRRWRNWQARWLRLPPLRPTPPPVRLPLFHAAVSFASLSVLPPHPLSIPTALAAGLAAVGIACLLARCAGKGEI